MKIITLTISEESLFTNNEIILTDFDGQDVNLVDITEAIDKPTYLNNRHNVALIDSYRNIGDCNVETVNDDGTESSTYHNMLLNETSRLLLVTTLELATDFTLEV